MSDSNDYEVRRLNLATIAGSERRKIYSAGRPIAAVTIVELPATMVGFVKLHFGPNGDPISLRQEALTFQRTPPRRDGVFLTVPAGAAGFLELLFGLDITTES